MDVYELLDEMEEFIEGSQSFPLTKKVLVNPEHLIDYLDKIRSLLPEEFRQSKWIMQEREKIIKEAQLQAEEILNKTQEQTCLLADDTEITKKAAEKAEKMMLKAQNFSLEIKKGAEDYADSILAGLQGELGKILETIEQNRYELKQADQDVAAGSQEYSK